jgi:hypothetical protein
MGANLQAPSNLCFAPHAYDCSHPAPTRGRFRRRPKSVGQEQVGACWSRAAGPEARRSISRVKILGCLKKRKPAGRPKILCGAVEAPPLKNPIAARHRPAPLASRGKRLKHTLGAQAREVEAVLIGQPTYRCHLGLHARAARDDTQGKADARTIARARVRLPQAQLVVSCPTPFRFMRLEAEGRCPIGK